MVTLRQTDRVEKSRQKDRRADRLTEKQLTPRQTGRQIDRRLANTPVVRQCRDVPQVR